MATKGSNSFKIGRDAKTGKLVPVETARQNPDRYVVEHMPKPGRGDVKK